MKFKVGDKVKHKDGVGEIIGFDDDNQYAVEFENEHNAQCIIFQIPIVQDLAIR